MHYFADTPDGAWAELLRHEEIRDPEDLATLRRALWAAEIPDDAAGAPALPGGVLTGDEDSYPACRAEARRLRASGARGLAAPSAALLPGDARGWRVDAGPHPGPDRDGLTIALFGARPDLVGWPATVAGRPGEDLLARVRHFRAARFRPARR